MRTCRAGLVVERVLAATASPSVLLVVLIGLGFLAVPQVSQAAWAVIGIEVRTGQLVLTLLWAVALIPLYQWRRFEWRRFEDAKVLGESRAARHDLSRYVPAALARRLERGGDLTCGACEVTVLFADICGFTTLSEGHSAAEIYSIVNPYAQMVSGLVRRHGGYVAEFRGDGLMALFGAPNALPQKERAAVEAGRAIVQGIVPLKIGAGASPLGTVLSVRVGIATGTDYVGDIDAGDYVVWSAIGNTTNLADRLQSLTRQFDAAMIIDARTGVAAGDATAGFRVRRNVTIRGRRDSEDVYILPLAEARSASQDTRHLPAGGGSAPCGAPPTAPAGPLGVAAAAALWNALTAAGR